LTVNISFGLDLKGCRSVAAKNILCRNYSRRSEGPVGAPGVAVFAPETISISANIEGIIAFCMKIEVFFISTMPPVRDVVIGLIYSALIFYASSSL
jgi:hypothetical protein